MKELRSSL